MTSFFFAPVIGFAQSPADAPRQGMGGASKTPAATATAATGAPVTYTSRRTVGVFDKQAPLVFEDVTARTGLNSFRHVSGSADAGYIIETTSGGVAIFDYDGDARPDIYLVNGSTMEAQAGRTRPPRAALFRNLGNMKFEDVTLKAGVANERWGMGVCAGDYDNDGDADLYVGNYGVSRLYRNNGDGTFTDVAESLGVARKGWSTGASFGDYDRDGRLDLFVPGYVEFDMNDLPPTPTGKNKAGKSALDLGCVFRGTPVMCGPRGLKGEADTLYHQKPDGTFEDVSQKTTVRDDPRYYGFSSVFARIDDDDLVDLLVVNDSTPKQLYINKGDGTFREAGYESGVALNENGREQAGMGLGVGDYDRDGRLDFYITNFSDDTDTLYRNDGGGFFTDVTNQAGVGEPTIPQLGWGTVFVDYDADGLQDIFIANGHVYPAVDNFQWGTSFAQQPLLFRNTGKNRFERVLGSEASGLSRAYAARGLAIGDLDGDGRIDAVLNNINAAPVILRNVAETANNYVIIRLVGDPAKRTPRDAVGTTVYLTAGSTRQRGDVVSGASYASQNDQRLHFGLGSAKRIDKLEVKWADGSVETIDAGANINRAITVTQGKGVTAR